jgi:hypothetical protein
MAQGHISLSLRTKENQEKEAEKIFNDTHPQYPPPQKIWIPKAVEEKQIATKIEKENNTCAAPCRYDRQPGQKGRTICTGRGPSNP